MNAEMIRSRATDCRQAADSEWDQLPAESHGAYEAFTLYRDKEASRSLSDVATELNHHTLATVTRWSTRWNWQERCRAFDMDQNERDSQDDHRERQAMRRRQIKVGLMMQEVANLGINELEQKAEKGGSLGLSPNEITTMITVGAELERKSRGEDLPSRQYAKIQVIFGDARLRRLEEQSAKQKLLDDDR